MSATLPDLESPLGLIDALLAEQQSMSAVERFSAAHEAGFEEPAQAKFYRDLLPASAPQPGEQYAFEVDLDACSGCKACVVACHALNGLEEEETWRKVGLLSGGAPSRVQHVTTACHHCVEPGCLSGCPVQAYEKDQATGIVRHLDDQCIGCKYCTMMCPYEVPQYSDTLGIVRKCDMCHQRLSAGEAPACVQSCPNGAIRIATVSQMEARQWAAEPDGKLVPQAPQSDLTIPTTRYVGEAQNERELRSQSQSVDHLAESHWPLAVMLVLTQVSFGMLLTERLAAAVSSWQGAGLAAEVTRGTLLASLLMGGLGLNIAALHLGQPLKAWRVFLGLRTSWLSREAIVLGKFYGLLALATGLAWLPMFQAYLPERFVAHLPARLFSIVYAAAIAVGAFGLFCSAMIYIATRRRLWRPARTLNRFYGTAVVGGLTVTVPVLLWFAVDRSLSLGLALLAIGAMLGKVWWEQRILLSREPSCDPLDERARRLAADALPQVVRLRTTAVVAAGTCLLMAALAGSAARSGLAVGFGVAAALLVILGEIIERLLYFSTVVHDRMPRIAR